MDSLGGTREAGKDQLNSLRHQGGTREAPGRQERINWTACEAPGKHQGGRKGPIGTREAPGRQERINWTACEAQGGTREEERTNRHQGGTREAGKDH